MGGGGGGEDERKETKQWMGYFTVRVGVELHLSRGSFSLLSYTEVTLGGVLYSSVYREVTKAD